MSQDLLYTYLVASKFSGFSLDEQCEMLTLWVDSFRTHGRFDGDIIVFTNVAPRMLPNLGVEFRPFSNMAPDKKAFFRERIATSRSLVAGPWVSALHVDLDALAVGPIADLFARDRYFRVAPSNWRTLQPEHAGLAFSPLVLRLLRLTGRGRGRGVSASVHSSRIEVMKRHLDLWQEASDRMQRLPAAASFGDQAPLNHLFVTRRTPIKVYNRAAIQHRRWKLTPDAKILHFPVADRVSQMRRFAEDANRRLG